MSGILFGIDAASFQGRVDWAEVATECAFGWEKVTEGTGYVNPFWRESRAAMEAQADAHGFIPGVYLFLDPGDGAAQADFFAEHAGTLDQWGIGIDVEKLGAGLAEAEACRARLHYHYPHHPVTGYLPHWYWGDQNTRFVDVLWASSYVSGGGPPAALYEQVPAAWWDAYGGRAPELLQFTSSAAVRGVSGAVDCSAYRGSAAALRQLLTGQKPPPAAPPPPVQLDGHVVWHTGGTLHQRGVISDDGGETWR